MLIVLLSVHCTDYAYFNYRLYNPIYETLFLIDSSSSRKLSNASAICILPNGLMLQNDAVGIATLRRVTLISNRTFVARTILFDSQMELKSITNCHFRNEFSRNYFTRNKVVDENVHLVILAVAEYIKYFQQYSMFPEHYEYYFFQSFYLRASKTFRRHIF